jgi:hypothetical protein
MAILAIFARAATAHAQDTANVAQVDAGARRVVEPEGPVNAANGLGSEDASVVSASPSYILHGVDSREAVPEAPSASALPPAPRVRGYKPITGNERLWWLFTTTLGPEHLAGGVISSAYGTAVNHPREDGTHWSGFGERFGIRLTGVAVSNTMEAGLGAIWGEDPRYDREAEQTFRERVASVIKQTFVTRRRDGEFAPAYARYMAITGSNFLSNTWRADSEADASHAAIRTLEGFAGRLATNSWDEFWPSAKARVFHHESR